jgi:hypothetical protein
VVRAAAASSPPARRKAAPGTVSIVQANKTAKMPGAIRPATLREAEVAPWS